MTFSPAFLARYEIVRKLGAGGMGEVYLAREASLDRLVAIKTVLSSAMGSEDARMRFLREARVTGALQHPAIVKVLDQGEDDGRLYIVYDYVGGGDLGRRLSEGGALAPAEFFAIAIPLLDAIAEAHKCGVLHRDIKADNVLLDAQGNPRLADFGLAKAAAVGGVQTMVGTLMGTPRYMAPELASGAPASPATDQYAMGVLMYEMLAGMPPFAGSTPIATLRMHADVPPPALVNYRGDVPEELEAAIARALAKTAAGRWEDVAAFRDALVAMETRVTWLPRATSSGVDTLYVPAGGTQPAPASGTTAIGTASAVRPGGAVAAVVAGAAGPGGAAPGDGPGARAQIDASRNVQGSGVRVRRGSGRVAVPGAATQPSPGQGYRVGTGERTRAVAGGAHASAGAPAPAGTAVTPTGGAGAVSRWAVAVVGLLALLGAGLMAKRLQRSDPRYAALAFEMDRGRNAAVLRWDSGLPGRDVTVRRAGESQEIARSAAGSDVTTLALPGLGLARLALDIELSDPRGSRYSYGGKLFSEITLDSVDAALARIRTVPGTEAASDVERSWALEERLEYRFTHALNGVFGRRPSRAERYSGMSQEQLAKAAARSGMDRAIEWYRENRLEMVLEQAAMLLSQPGDWRTKAAVVRTAHAIANLEAFLLSSGLKVAAPALRFQFGLKPGRMPGSRRPVLDGPGDFTRPDWYSALLTDEHELKSAKLSLSQGLAGGKWYTRAVEFQLAARNLKPRLSDPVGGLLAAANTDEAFPLEYVNEGIGTGWSQMVLEPVTLEGLRLSPPVKPVSGATLLLQLRAASELTHVDINLGPLLFCFRTPPGFAAYRDAHAWGPVVQAEDLASSDPILSSADPSKGRPRVGRPGLLHKARFDAAALEAIKTAPVLSVHCARGDGTLDKPTFWMPSWKVFINTVGIRWDQAAE